MKPVTATMLLIAVCSFAMRPVQASDYLSRPDVRAFIDTMRAEHGVETSDLERILGAVRFQPTVVRLLGPVPS